MQQNTFKNTNLTIPQRFFIQKSLEMVYHQTIDSYRVKVKSPKSILFEIKSCLEAYEAKQIKHFPTIAGDGKHTFSLNNEASNFLKIEPNYIKFNAVSKEYFEVCLKELSENNYKKCKKAIELILADNTSYIQQLLEALSVLIAKPHSNNTELLLILKDIDTTVGFLFTELVELGFSKGFLYRKLRGLFINSLTNSETFEAKFQELVDRVKQVENEYDVIFRVDSGKKIDNALSSTAQNNMQVYSDINSYMPNKEQEQNYKTKEKEKVLQELKLFNAPKVGRKYLKCTIKTTDYITALKRAKTALSQNVDIINLGFSDDYIHIHHRVLVVDVSKPHNADFQTSRHFLDGKYTATHDYYSSFIAKLPTIISNGKIPNDNIEKVKSALRYLRLGNESIEVEHKFINYWIGLEYLFSNYESSSTIARIKEHFITAHSLIYVKRNVNAFFKYFDKLPVGIKSTINGYNASTNEHKSQQVFYQDVFDKMIERNPLMAYRAMRLMEKMFASDGKSSLKKYLQRHKENLLIHFTRIYRMRNEIVHDAITDTNYEQIASNLRYYLTFILNGIIDYLHESTDEQITIENYFTVNEVFLGNIEREGYPLQKLLDINASINFIS